uniref:Uncharacterized protein n=1 Tax=Panstrongylus lignarius TaxID=156445 RepID=A0A224XW25_9HEMI
MAKLALAICSSIAAMNGLTNFCCSTMLLLLGLHTFCSSTLCLASFFSFTLSFFFFLHSGGRVIAAAGVSTKVSLLCDIDTTSMCNSGSSFTGFTSGNCTGTSSLMFTLPRLTASITSSKPVHFSSSLMSTSTSISSLTLDIFLNILSFCLSNSEGNLTSSACDSTLIVDFSDNGDLEGFIKLVVCNCNDGVCIACCCLRWLFLLVLFTVALLLIDAHIGGWNALLALRVGEGDRCSTVLGIFGNFGLTSLTTLKKKER